MAKISRRPAAGMVARRALTLSVSICVAVGVGCGGGGGGGSNGAGSVVAARSASGRVILPPAFQGSLSTLKVVTSLDQQPVAANGSFHVSALSPAPVLAKLLDSSGRLILLGYVDGAASGSPYAGGAGEISAKQTALALLMFGTGAFTAPANTWQQIQSIIMQSSEVPQLSAVVSARVAADPTALSDGDAQILAAAQQASAALVKNGRAAPMPGRRATAARSATAVKAATVTVVRGAGRAAGRDAGSLILVQPSGEQSGVEVVNNPNGSGIVFINHLRRRCAAFAYETATQQPGGDLTQLSLPKPLAFTQASALSALLTQLHLNPAGSTNSSLEVGPANALHGVIGSITDALQGSSAFTPLTSPPTGDVQLPQDGAAIKTVYTIVVVGPAFQDATVGLGVFPLANDTTFSTFVPQWQAAITALSWEEWILDIAIPVLSNVSPWMVRLNLSENAQTTIAVVQELANALSNVPDLGSSIENGDFKGAMTSFVQTIVDNATTRDAVITAIYSQFTPEVTLHGQLATAEEDLEGAFKAVEVVELILQAVDSSAVLVASSTNNPGEEWTATVVQKTVRLNPQTANVSIDLPTVDLTASPGVQGDPAAPFVYHWNVGGQAGGGIEDSTHLTGHDKDFDSADSQITYALGPSAQVGQTDTVTVEVFDNAGTLSHPARGTRLGQAQCVVTVAPSVCPAGTPTLEQLAFGDTSLGSFPQFKVNGVITPANRLILHRGDTLQVTVSYVDKSGFYGQVFISDADPNQPVLIDGQPQQISTNLNEVSGSVFTGGFKTPKPYPDIGLIVSPPSPDPNGAAGTHTIQVKIRPYQLGDWGCASISSDGNIFGPWVMLVFNDYFAQLAVPFRIVD